MTGVDVVLVVLLQNYTGFTVFNGIFFFLCMTGC